MNIFCNELFKSKKKLKNQKQNEKEYKNESILLKLIFYNLIFWNKIMNLEIT